MSRFHLLLGLLPVLALTALPGLSVAGMPVPGTAASAPQAQRDPQTAVPWSRLDPDTRHLLAPMQSRWNRMPAHVQHHIVHKAEHWKTLPEKRREAIRQRIARWEKMSPDERRRARANHRAYRHLDSRQRKRLHQAYERFKKLPTDEQRQLRQQWHQLSPDQRRQWIRNGADGSLPSPNASTGRH